MLLSSTLCCSMVCGRPTPSAPWRNTRPQCDTAPPTRFRSHSTTCAPPPAQSSDDDSENDHDVAFLQAQLASANRRLEDLQRVLDNATEQPAPQAQGSSDNLVQQPHSSQPSVMRCFSNQRVNLSDTPTVEQAMQRQPAIRILSQVSLFIPGFSHSGP